MAIHSQTCALVLIRRAFGRKRALARALAQALGGDDDWALKLVRSAPVVLFDNLPADQAQRILDVLADTADALKFFEIQFGADPALPRVAWAAPPRIKGVVLDDYRGARSGQPGTTTRAPAILSQTKLVSVTAQSGLVEGRREKRKTQS